MRDEMMDRMTDERRKELEQGTEEFIKDLERSKQMSEQLKKYMEANLLDGDKVHDCIMVSSKECYDVMKEYLKDYKPEIDEVKLNIIAQVYCKEEHSKKEVDANLLSDIIKLIIQNQDKLFKEER